MTFNFRAEKVSHSGEEQAAVCEAVPRDVEPNKRAATGRLLQHQARLLLVP